MFGMRGYALLRTTTTRGTRNDAIRSPTMFGVFDYALLYTPNISGPRNAFETLTDYVDYVRVCTTMHP